MSDPAPSRPRARTISKPENTADKELTRAPKAFTPAKVAEAAEDEAWLDAPAMLDPLTAQAGARNPNWLLRLAFGAGGLLLSLALGLAVEGLVRDLFARYDWLGWVAIAAAALLVVGVLGFVFNEWRAMRRLANLDHLRDRAAATLQSNLPDDGRKVVAELESIYQSRPDLAGGRQKLTARAQDLLDGRDLVQLAETSLMPLLDRRARELTSAAARRVAVVTAISPRAIVDIAFVLFESVKLARAIAALYGARPGLFSSWRLLSEVLAHLAVTGGVAMGDSVIQQLLGHGLAAKLSARLGEGLVNGLMTARVGIATMKVTRPLPFDRLRQPQVLDYAAELGKITGIGTGA
ncbi:MAG: TIGR01620 family protein [Hyphomicrobiaceae bacterium]|nr:TIGR01620 family protein [Hyphomicrobiaceae bacterium]